MPDCPRCGHEILRALTPDGTRVTLDAAKTPQGDYAAWRVRRGVSWLWLARPADEPGRRPNSNEPGAYQQHDCPGSVGEQMQIGAA